MATPTGERRDTIRLHCSISATLKTKKTTKEVRLINASLTGVAVEMEFKMKRKTAVTIHRDQYGGPVVGHVIWCRALKGSDRYQVGVAYADDKEMLKNSWLKPALKDLGFTVGRINEKRNLMRVPGQHRRCFLKSFAGDTYSSGELLNLSLGGALVASEVEIPKGLRLKLKTDPIGNLPELIMDAETKSCKRDARSRRYLVGLLFTDGDEKMVKKHLALMMQEC